MLLDHATFWCREALLAAADGVALSALVSCHLAVNSTHLSKPGPVGECDG